MPFQELRWKKQNFTRGSNNYIYW